MRRGARLYLFILSTFASSLSIATPKIGVRRFLRNCFAAMTDPAQIAKNIDFRNSFLHEVDKVLKSNPHVKILDLGSYDYHPWSIAVAEALTSSERGPSSSVHTFALSKGEIVKTESSDAAAPSPGKGFHIIFDAGLGPASQLTELSKTLHYANRNLSEGGILAIAFPHSKNPLTNTPADATAKIMSSLKDDLGLLHLDRRYNFLKAYPPSTNPSDYVRLDGTYVKKKNGKFEPLITWVANNFPDLEVVPAPLDLGTGALKFMDPFMHTSNMLHFNQLILRKKKSADISQKPEESKSKNPPKLQYVGTIGSKDGQSMSTLPFHFFDELN